MSHQPVLLQAVVQGLAPAPTDTVIDATLGDGGHALALGQGLGPRGQLIGLDQDADAISAAAKTLAGLNCRVTLSLGNFRDLKTILAKRDLKNVNAILLDLGISSNQLAESGRGFTFQKDEPLLMTMTKDYAAAPLVAADIVNSWPEEKIATILYQFGEERLARRIAKAIVTARKHKRLVTTLDLVAVINSAVPAAYLAGRIHPATRTFQALRIAVNDELGALSDGLVAAWAALAPGGRLAIVSFHSLEARLVKTFFAEKVRIGSGQMLTHPVVKPSVAEVAGNPRARSAQLRLIVKLS